MDDRMKALVEAPLADANRTYLPEGKKRAPRSRKQHYADGIGVPKLTAKQLADRNTAHQDGKIRALLDYYATTNVPTCRISEHIKMDEVHVIEAMRLRGRIS